MLPKYYAVEISKNHTRWGEVEEWFAKLDHEDIMKAMNAYSYIGLDYIKSVGKPFVNLSRHSISFYQDVQFLTIEELLEGIEEEKNSKEALYIEHQIQEEANTPDLWDEAIREARVKTLYDYELIPYLRTNYNLIKK